MTVLVVLVLPVIVLGFMSLLVLFLGALLDAITVFRRES
jgi:hypothetical protein